MATAKGTGRSVSSAAKATKTLTKLPAKKPAATKPSKAPAKKTAPRATVMGLDEVLTLVRQLIPEVSGGLRHQDIQTLVAMAHRLVALGRVDLAISLLDELPPDRRAVARLPVEAASGHDIEPLWKPWLAAIEAKNTFDGRIDVESVMNDLAAAIREAREPSRSQLVERARARLEGTRPRQTDWPILGLLVKTGDLDGALKLVERLDDTKHKALFSKAGCVTRLATALLEQGQHEAAITLLARLSPDAVYLVLRDGGVFRGPLPPGARKRLGRLLDTLPAEQAAEVRGSLGAVDGLARVLAGEDLAPGEHDSFILTALLEAGQLDVARRFLDGRPSPGKVAERWALARFKVGLDDLDALDAALDITVDWPVRLRGLLGAMRVMLARDPHDPRIDRVWSLVEAMRKDIPPSDHDASFVGRVEVDALLARADVDLARGQDIVPILERVCEPALLESASGEAKEVIIARWQKLGRPDRAEATVVGVFSFLRSRYLPLVAAGFLPDLGRAVASLRRLGDSNVSGLLRNLTELLESMRATGV